jgi:hypothetical protein
MEHVTLTRKEQTRVKILNEVNEGVLTAGEAAGLLGVSLERPMKNCRSRNVPNAQNMRVKAYAASEQKTTSPIVRPAVMITELMDRRTNDSPEPVSTYNY